MTAERQPWSAQTCLHCNVCRCSVQLVIQGQAGGGRGGPAWLGGVKAEGSSVIVPEHVSQYMPHSAIITCPYLFTDVVLTDLYASVASTEMKPQCPRWKLCMLQLYATATLQ